MVVYKNGTSGVFARISAHLYDRHRLQVFADGRRH